MLFLRATGDHKMARENLSFPAIIPQPTADLQVHRGKPSPGVVLLYARKKPTGILCETRYCYRAQAYSLNNLQSRDFCR